MQFTKQAMMLLSVLAPISVTGSVVFHFSDAKGRGIGPSFDITESCCFSSPKAYKLYFTARGATWKQGSHCLHGFKARDCQGAEATQSFDELELDGKYDVDKDVVGSASYRWTTGVCSEDSGFRNEARRNEARAPGKCRKIRRTGRPAGPAVDQDSTE